MQRLGATDLDPSFCDRQWRKMFCALAKQLHPDRHPTAVPWERRRLAQECAAMCDAYRELSHSTPEL